MKLGIDSYSTRNSGLDAVGVLGWPADLGLAGVLFELSPFDRSATTTWPRSAPTAEEKGLYVEFGMGSILHWHPMAEKGRRLLADAGCDADVSDAQMVIGHLHVATKARLADPPLRGGQPFTRDEGHDMTAMADQAVAILREACRGGRGPGHEDRHGDPRRFHGPGAGVDPARVNSPAFGFTVDTANLAFDLDDPLRLAEILAPHALTTHFKNYRIIRTREGLALENCSLGDGRDRLGGHRRAAGQHNPGRST